MSAMMRRTSLDIFCSQTQMTDHQQASSSSLLAKRRERNRPRFVARDQGVHGQNSPTASKCSRCKKTMRTMYQAKPTSQPTPRPQLEQLLQGTTQVRDSLVAQQLAAHPVARDL